MKLAREPTDSTIVGQQTARRLSQNTQRGCRGSMRAVIFRNFQEIFKLGFFQRGTMADDIVSTLKHPSFTFLFLYIYSIYHNTMFLMLLE